MPFPYPNSWLLFILISVPLITLGHLVLCRLKVIEIPSCLFTRLLLCGGAGYVFSILPLNLLYAAGLPFLKAWTFYLFSALAVTLLWWVRGRGREILAPGKANTPLLGLVFVFGILSSVATVEMWNHPSCLGMAHADKFAMFAKLIVWENYHDFTQHYGHSLMTAGIGSFTGFSFELINWLTQNLLKMSLLATIYTVLIRVRERGLLAWLCTFFFAFGFGSIDLQYYDLVDSGGPFLFTTYPDRIVGFIVLFHWIAFIHCVAQRSWTLSKDGFHGFLLLSTGTVCLLAITSEDLIPLLGIPMLICGLWVLAHQVWVQRSGLPVFQTALALMLAAYLLVTQGGVLTERAETSGRTSLKHARSFGEHQIAVNLSSPGIRKSAFIDYRLFPKDGTGYVFTRHYGHGFGALWICLRASGVGLLCWLALQIWRRFTTTAREFFRPSTLSYTVLWMMGGGMFLSLMLDVGFGGETGRFMQWSLFLSFLIVGHLVYGLLQQRTWAARFAGCLVGLWAIFPSFNILCRPFMWAHFQRLVEMFRYQTWFLAP